MLAIAITAVLRRRQIGVGPVLAIAAVIVFVDDPLAAMTPGFHLSFAAVVALNINNFALMNTVEVLGMVPVYIQSTVILIGLLLIYYSRSAKAKGWLA